MSDDRRAGGFIPTVYGRSQDRPLRAGQRRLMETLLPRVDASVEAGAPAGSVDPARFFDDVDAVHLEVGFGGGEHLAWQAARNPRIGHIGVEPFVNGVAKLLGAIDREQLGNIRIRHGDARPFLERLAPASLARLYVLHPDPWPKRRHWKRRMVSPWFFREAARLLRPGGELRVSSDIPDYIDWTLMHWRGAAGFAWRADRADDWRTPPADWPITRYGEKALRAGRTPIYLIFERA
ncbi:MAG: tRNA (guanosine(46)-N7)-methyltransferase TrmB [Pseudomonadota bacterium]